ncbi:SHOCT domain-containing protein [Nocardioides taihuensis]|uniref:SHOCT domain-containing protein n=1 Tax=Nocardioides taihuensis TaxID=1835606 RepID=A0ABW0BE97_9ACTN
MAEERKGFWASLMPDPDELARGMVDSATTMKIYKDGTFTVQSTFAKESARDRLIGFDHDADSMRRKSVTGRSGAAMMTGGLSLLASNNRGVIYVTVTGENTKVRTFTTRNPSGTQLTSIRSLKAAAETVLAQSVGAIPGGEVSAQLKQLADLHAAGALSADEFAAAKKRLLG